MLTAVLVVPYFIDWTSYKAEFEREASRILGRDVVVRGSARARLLPLPSVTFTDVEVAGTKPGEPAITVETFSMDAELAPFLRGELLIFDMRRYLTLMESDFPTELGSAFRGMENQSNPWGLSQADRLEWTKNLDDDVIVLEPGDRIQTEYLYWVGCAGA